MKFDHDYRDIMHQARRAVLRQVSVTGKDKKPLAGQQKLRKASKELAKWLDDHTKWPKGLVGDIGEAVDRPLFWRPFATAFVQLAYNVLKAAGIDFARIAGDELEDQVDEDLET